MSRHVGRALLVALACGAMLWGCRGAPPDTQLPIEPIGGHVAAAEQTVREPAVAGAFYPGDAQELDGAVREMLAAADRVELPGRVIALMAPHAGYIYSGPTAAAAYAQIEGLDIDTVIVIGPSHRVPVTGVALPEADTWHTPLGEVPIDTEMCAALREASDLFAPNALAHRYEHSLEVQLPFLQTVLDDFALVPLVAQDFPAESCRAAAEAIAQVAAGRSVLLVASSDMSHYPVYEQANRVDAAMLDTIATFDGDAVFARDAELMGEGVADLGCTLCGLEPVVTVMEAAKLLGADSAHVIHYANSGDAPAGDRGHCVGYGAVAFCGAEQPGAAEEPAEPAATDDAEGAAGDAAQEGELDAEQQAILLALARETIGAHVAGGQVPSPPDDAPIFGEERAVFVTLHEHGMLRGCIGSLEAREPLGEAIISSAISAATRDPRFRPVTADEIDDLHIEISVLSPMRLVDSAEEIVVGTHGVLVRQGVRSGVFLPQVAPEQGWDREEMLRHLCAEKAGLAADAWRHGARLYVFTAQVFGEAE